MTDVQERLARALRECMQHSGNLFLCDEDVQRLAGVLLAHGVTFRDDEIERLEREIKDHAEWAAKMMADPNSEPFQILLRENAKLRATRAPTERAVEAALHEIDDLAQCIRLTENDKDTSRALLTAQCHALAIQDHLDDLGITGTLRLAAAKEMA